MHDTKLGLEILLEGPHPALWDSYCQRETLRFLRKSGGKIPKKELLRLENAILAGPPIKKPRTRSKKKQAEEKLTRNHAIRLRLFKLKESGAKLSRYGVNEYNRIEKEIPWTPSDNNSEEFPFYVTSGRRMLGVSRRETSIEDFASMTVDKFIKWSETQTGRPWECGGGWTTFLEENLDAGITLLESAEAQETWPIAPWYAALAVREGEHKWPPKTFRRISACIANMPPDRLVDLEIQTARWLEDHRKKLPRLERLQLLRRIWDASLLSGPLDNEVDYDMTLNHPGGLLAQVLYDEMADYIPEIGPKDFRGFPKSLKNDFYRFGDDNTTARLARIRVTPMLYILARVDPTWTQATLLRRMDYRNRKEFDPILWEAFFWSPRWTDDLFPIIKPLFFNILRNLDKLEIRTSSNAPEIFIHMAIPPGRGINADEAKGVLSSFSTEHLGNAAQALRTIVEAAGTKSETLWNETIGPWFDRVWPSRIQDRSPELSEKLAWLAINSGDAFPSAVDSIEGRLTEERHSGALYHLAQSEKESGLVSKYPEASLRLVNKLVDDTKMTDLESLKIILVAISKADESLESRRSYKRLGLLL